MMKDEQTAWPPSNRSKKIKYFIYWALGVLLFYYCWNAISANTTWIFVLDAPEKAANLIGRMFPPNWSYINQLWEPIWDTINIATLGTLLALLIAIIVSLMAARNTTPHPLLRQLALLIIVTSRSVNSLIWALMLVTIIGPGVLAGIIAIGIRSIGFTSKLLYEGIEEIDTTPVEAVTATGANKPQVITYSIIPQMIPTFLSVAVYRWDINIRESTIVGIVGAGGLGIPLNTSILSMQWSNAIIILLVILIMVFASEALSAKFRELTI